MNGQELLHSAQYAKPELHFFQSITVVPPMEMSPDLFDRAASIAAQADGSRGTIAMQTDANLTPLEVNDMAGALLYIRTHSFSLPVVLLGPKGAIRETIGVKPIARLHIPDDREFLLGGDVEWNISLRRPKNATEFRVSTFGQITEALTTTPHHGYTGGPAGLFEETADGTVHQRLFPTDISYELPASLSIVYVDCIPICKHGTMNAINLIVGL